MTSWFASDLHLDPSTPEIAARFQRFLTGPVRGARSLFLLGDLFEAWLGDDDPEPAHRDVIRSIAALAAGGTLVYVMRGNRDFMIGERFCSEAGAILLDDPAITTLAGKRLIFSHGDGLCVDDRAYQRLRALVRDENLRAGFAPADRGAAQARIGGPRGQSRAPRECVEYITDVNQPAVESLMRDAGAELMIHGHTHRPGVHRFESGGLARTRIVLGAWHDEANVIRWDDQARNSCPAQYESSPGATGRRPGWLARSARNYPPAPSADVVAPDGRGRERVTARTGSRASEGTPPGQASAREPRPSAPSRRARVRSPHRVTGPRSSSGASDPSQCSCRAALRSA